MDKYKSFISQFQKNSDYVVQTGYQAYDYLLTLSIRSKLLTNDIASVVH